MHAFVRDEPGKNPPQQQELADDLARREAERLALAHVLADELGERASAPQALGLRLGELSRQLGDERGQVAELAKPPEALKRGDRVVEQPFVDGRERELPGRGPDLVRELVERRRFASFHASHHEAARRTPEIGQARLHCLGFRPLPGDRAGGGAGGSDRRFHPTPAGDPHPTTREEPNGTSACESSWRPESISATRRAAGTRRCGASSSASAAASTSSTSSRRSTAARGGARASRATSPSAAAPCSSSARRSRPRTRSRSRRSASACRT